jgi:hypothetical protein
VSEYTGLDFIQIGKLNYLQYLTYLKDAYIYRLNKTEGGREYLKNCYRMEQTKPDRVALRRKLGKEGAHGKQYN